MPPQQAAALGAGAASIGAALAVNVAVQSLIQALAVALEEEDEQKIPKQNGPQID
jgi:F0F1-type ATP synthase membrane subunit c/vacuolar-type H+-ATPase subunit K